ncbi:hypothetical protein SBI67_28535 [Mycolicibacterium sp. 120266]|uniref:hypothetical protein n=1 Tax=Mycolicibacterium sp. 120266 TaxID=3090601 RepID=UPI00299DBDC9|nr:hypothetical protein [Mycolicibacterium sp. 120266]MDX1876086.1 hypothetical protein [Mycolicibacterium sp. 120266]
MATIRDLTSLVPPPEQPQKQWNWDRIESNLGFIVPDDYRQIVDTHGRGKFDNFLRVFTPDDLGQQIQIKRDALRMAANSQELFGVQPTETPYPIEALTVCAYTDNGDDIYWSSDSSSDPNTWRIVVHATRDEEWDAFDGPLIEFLVAVFSGSYVCPIFPDDFPGSAVSRFVSQ